ncbi:7 transmembrane sweet-taste receptor of 3 GCPR-domain-containing protein [Phlyctochytrium arcticum]|nr:7 transmembrane sweet-taste receptor of 3 GCPR-domain-containing protein [Phlyctochytrium arcticum]
MMIPVYLLTVLAFGTLIAHAAINDDQLGGPGMALHLTPYPIYPKETSYRNLMEKGNFAEVSGAEIKQQVQYESGARLWNSVHDFTFEAWVKPGLNEGRTCCWPLLETYSTTDASAPAFIVKIGDGGIVMFVTRGGLTPGNTCYTEERSVVTDWSAFDGKWHHVAVTFDSTNGRKILYGDGQVLKNWTCIPSEVVKAEGGSFNIGWTKRSTPPGPYDGYLDEVRAWNVTRTQAEIQAAMYHTIRNPADIAKMIFYYPMDSFDPLQPFLLKDMSPSGFDVKMSNIERGAPKFVPSGALLSGGQVSYHSLTRASGTHNGQTEVALVNSTVATGLSITITSFPNCTTPNALLSTANTGAVTAGGVTTFPAANKLIITAGASSVGTSSEEMCSFKYTITDGTTTTSAYTVNLLLTVNRAPIVGDAGGALYCDGDDFAYNKDFTFNRPLYGEYTIEFWSYHFYSDGVLATLFSVGNNEIGVPYDGNWCLQQNTRWNTSDFCIGRFKFDQYTASGRAEMYNSWNASNDDGFLTLDIGPYFEQWKHTAIVSKSDKLQMYLNGKLFGETTNHPFYGARDGIYLCHWPFWGHHHWYKGFIDEFRVFNYTKSQQQIQSTMHRTLTGSEDGLIGYWNFDEVRDTTAMGAVYNPKTKIVDKSINKFHLTPGGCVPNVRPQCPLGDTLCRHTEVPQTPFYDSDGTTQKLDQRPALYTSNAPLGGYTQPLLAGAGQNATFILDAFDPDGDALSITILAIPDRGAFYKSDGSKVAVGDSFEKGTELRFWNEDMLAGGYPATKFSYRVSDGKDTGALIAAVDIYVKCPNATFLDSSQNRCVACPYGSYMMSESGFETKCYKFSNFLWSSPLGIIILLFTSAGLAAGAGTAVFVLVYRKSKVVRAASPVFCLMIIAGAILALIAVFFYLDIPTPAACILQPLLVSVAFTLSIGNLVIKTMRVNIVFNYPLLARRLKWVLKDGFLIGVSVCAVLLDLIILVIWFVVDRPRPTMLRDVNEELYWGCNSSTPGFSNKASGALIAYNGLMLLAGIYSAYKVRNVKSAFNESQHIVPSIYIITLVSIILLPMNYAVELFTYKVRSLFVAFLLIVCSLFVLLQLFVPKIMAVRDKGAGGDEIMTGITTAADASNMILRTTSTSPSEASSEPMRGERRLDSVGTTSHQEEEMQAFHNNYMGVTLVQAQIGGGFLSGFSAYSAILPSGLNAIILRKYRQNVASYFSYSPSSVTKVGDEMVGFTSLDGQKIKLKFEKSGSRDQWFVALKAGGSGGKSKNTLLRLP